MTIETLKLYASNPWLWVYIGTPFLVIILLPYIRKLYPKDIQKNIIECEAMRKNPDKTTLTIQKKINKLNLILFTVCFIFFLTIIMIFHNKVISTYSIRNWLLNLFAPSMFISIGISMLFERYLLKKILTKTEYKKHLAKKEQCLDSEFKISQKFILFINKYQKEFGIIFIIIGILCFFTPIQ